MPTFGELAEHHEEQHFVGREHELATFANWVSSGAPVILNVWGPAGIGKSALLRAFQRHARALGRPAIQVTAQDFRRSHTGLVGALGVGLNAPAELDPVIEHLNRQQPLLLLDAGQQAPDLMTSLRDELLPSLDARVRVVIAGREPLNRQGHSPDVGLRLMRDLPLGGLSRADATTYLERRGLRDPHLLAQILRTVNGHPLALTLAADLALQAHAGPFERAPAWRLVVRMLADRLVQDVQPAALRDLLEAAAIVRQFDEGLLRAMVGSARALRPFDTLWHLSFVEPAEYGLMLHASVRRILAQDLRLRDRDRDRDLRRHALAHYCLRMASALRNERERLLAETLFLYEDATVHDVLFADAEPAQVWLERGRPEDWDDVLRVRTVWLQQVLPPAARPIFDPAQDAALLQALLEYPGTRLQVARDRAGRVLGFTTVVPVCEESVRILELYPGLVPALSTYSTGLPPAADKATVFYLLHLAHADLMHDAVLAVLLRGLLSVVAHGGVYLTATPLPTLQDLFERLGWQHLSGARKAEAPAVETYVLDLQRIGVDAWLAGLLGVAPSADPGATGGARAVPPPPLPAPSAGPPEAEDHDLGGLTARERELVALIARGFQNRQIAAALELSVRTVDAHLEHIRRKLGIRTRVEIAVWAARHGLVEPA
jgi:DNA-binding CsgD family transcriptional regulator